MEVCCAPGGCRWDDQRCHAGARRWRWRRFESAAELEGGAGRCAQASSVGRAAFAGVACGCSVSRFAASTNQRSEDRCAFGRAGSATGLEEAAGHGSQDGEASETGASAGGAFAPGNPSAHCAGADRIQTSPCTAYAASCGILESCAYGTFAQFCSALCADGRYRSGPNAPRSTETASGSTETSAARHHDHNDCNHDIGV